MSLSQTIQSDFKRMFTLEDIQYPFSLRDILQIHTQSKDATQLYKYLHTSLYESFLNSSLHMSMYDIEIPSKTFEYSIADVYIITNSLLNKDDENSKVNSQNDFEVLYKTKKYSILVRKEGPYALFKSIEKSNMYSSYDHILFKIMCNDTLVLVMLDMKHKHLDIVYSHNIHGNSIEDLKLFNRVLLHNCKKIFGDITFNLVYFGSQIIDNKDICNSYLWFVLSLKYFSPTTDITQIKKYIQSLKPEKRHNMIINWANFMIKYSKHLKDVTFDSFMISEFMHVKDKKKLLEQKGGAIYKETNKKKNNFYN